MIRRTSRQRCPRLGVLLALVLAAGGALAAPGDVVLGGRVTDRAGRVGFEGAIVRVEELGIEVASGRDGEFRLPPIPPGAYVLTVRYVGAPVATRRIDVVASGSLGDVAIGADVPMLANVLVVGLVAGQAEAASRKRAADAFVDVLASDGLGDLPDHNVTDALKRLPGVSIVTEQGEGRFVAIRGVDPNLNAVSLGGVRLPTGEDDARAVALDVVPAELVEHAEVSKSATPDQDGDGLGGSVDLRTLSAFDRPGRSASARLEVHHHDLESTRSERYAASATRVLALESGDELGIALSGSVLDRTFGWDAIEAAGWPVLDADDGAFRSLGSIEQLDARVDFERRAIALAADWRRGAGAEAYVRAFRSEVDEFLSLAGNAYRFDPGALEALDASSGAFGDATIDKGTTYRLESRAVTSIAAGGGVSAGAWRLEGETANARSTEREPGSLDARFRGEADAAYRGTGPRPLVAPTEPEGFDAGAYVLNEVAEEVEDIEDRETHFAASARRELAFAGAPAFVKFGAKARRREKSSDVDVQVYDGFGRDVLLSEFASSRSYAFGPLGTVIAPGALRDYVERNRGSFELDDEETGIGSRGFDYTIDEDVDAAYLMAGGDFGAWRVVAGARVERTRLAAAGTRVTVGADDGEALRLEPVAADSRYTNVLPGVHLRWEPVARILVRGALTRSISRPSFGDLAPAQRVEIEAVGAARVVRAEVGDPALQPYRSTNLDLGVEYYDDGALGVFSAALFAKRIEDFVVRTDVAGTRFPEFDEAIAPVNGERAKLEGIELAWTRRFTDLPAPWDGVLVAANATFVDSEATLPLAGRALPLPNQSDVLANLVLGYERGGLSLRIAGNWRGERLVRLDEPEDPAFDVYEGDRMLVDLSVKYRFAPRWQLYLDVANVAGRPLYEYYGDRAHAARYEDYGRAWHLGIKFDH